LTQGGHHSRYRTNYHRQIFLSFIDCCVAMLVSSPYLYEVVFGGSSYEVVI
jgi:hypothetical protein